MLNPVKNKPRGLVMGFAKYHEDIVSRFIYDQTMRNNTKVIKPIDNRHHIKGKASMTDLKKFVLATPRPLPVIVLADTSGSMGENGKIDALNAAIKDMVATFGKESRLRAELQVGLITFGGKAELHLPLVAAHTVSDMQEFQAQGATPMGEAFELARQLLEDKDKIPSRAYRPALILVSDGLPTDDWETSFKSLCVSERAQKATRFAMSIGADADEDMLKEFTNDSEAPLFKAHNARDIHRFFRAVTMSLTTRTASQNPEQSSMLVIPPPMSEDDDIDF
jgi:uncharacterized protein YegL